MPADFGYIFATMVVLILQNKISIEKMKKETHKKNLFFSG